MDVADFEAFLQAYERDLFSFCRYLAMDEDTASDLYQETALQAFKMIARIDSSQNPKSLLFGIAVGKWKNMRRKTIRRQNIAPEVSFEGATNAHDKSATPEEAAQKALLRDCIQKTLAAMPDKFRIPLVLYYFDDSPTDVIASICKIPKGTVKSRLHKGRALMKEALEKEGFSGG